MEMQNLFMNLLFLIGIIGFIIYFKHKNNNLTIKKDFKKDYIDVLNSEKYKVKGKFE